MVEAQFDLDRQIDQELLASLRHQATRDLAKLQREIEALNRGIRLATEGTIELPEVVIPEPEIDPALHGMPIISSAWPWVEQTKALIARKAYDAEAGMSRPAMLDLFGACGVVLPVPDARIVRPRGSPVPRSKVDPARIRASLLADNAGVYGVGLTAGDRMVCGDTYGQPKPDIRPYAICLRRFDLAPRPSLRPALHAIPPGRMWRHTAEYELADQLLTAMLARAGFPREQGHGRGKWWSHDKGEQNATGASITRANYAPMRSSTL